MGYGDVACYVDWTIGRVLNKSDYFVLQVANQTFFIPTSTSEFRLN